MNIKTKWIEKMKDLEAKGEVVPGTADCVFKSLLQLDDLKGILVYLLSEITGLDKSFIYENLKFTNTEIPKERYTDKGQITDLLIDIENLRINLEMCQRLDEGNLNKNNTYHHNLAGKRLYIKENYQNVKKVIQICFNKEDSLKKFGNENIVEFKMRSKNGKYCLDETFINYQINLEKITEKYYNEEKLSRLEKILLLLTLNKKEDLKEVSKDDKELMVMEERIEEFSQNPEIVGLYDEEKVREEVNRINIEAAEAKGSKQKQIEIAKNMISMGMDPETISRATALSKKEIEELS